MLRKKFETIISGNLITGRSYELIEDVICRIYYYSSTKTGLVIWEVVYKTDIMPDFDKELILTGCTHEIVSADSLFRIKISEGESSYRLEVAKK